MGAIPGHNHVTVQKKEELLVLIVNITKRFGASGNIYPIKNPMRESNTNHTFPSAEKSQKILFMSYF